MQHVHETIKQDD